jgi:hypothetical protein
MKVVWEIKDKEGKVVKRGEHDKLATKNFIRLLAKIFTHSPLSLTNDSGNATTGDYNYGFRIGYADAFVQLGTGLISPTRDDYKLSGEVITKGDVSVTLDESGGIVTVGFTWTPSADTTVNEVGLFAYVEYANYLLDRFLLQQTVSAGQTLSIAWIINLGGL